VMLESALPSQLQVCTPRGEAAVSEDRSLRVSKFLVMGEQSPWPFSPA